MAEPLKHQFGPGVVRSIAAMLQAAEPAFPRDAFVADVLDGFEALELKARAQHLADAMQRHLPEPYPRALDVVLRSVGPPLAATSGNGMAPFLYLPHTLFVARQGLADEHFDASMGALHALTRRFTGEFAIRPFIERHPGRALRWLNEWTRDPDEHVRRLVSEGTRPRLPWGARLRVFERDPRPALELLERLKDDPSDYVRRSVANHLNDVGKDHPALLLRTCERWLRDAPAARRALVRHALRSLAKRGDAKALSLLGFGASPAVRVERPGFEPPSARIGDAVTLRFALADTGGRVQSLRVDLCVFYVKASGAASPKVFRLREIELPGDGRVEIAHRLSLRQMTTRKHHPGRHRVEALVNGHALPLGAFELTL
jgi:3-methyladenine DNA glycosylase AlkC